MTEEVQNEDIVAVVKEAVDGAIETKADKSDLEVFAKSEDMPSVEGLAAEADVAKLSEALEAEVAKREELEAIVKSAPAIVKGDDVEATEIKFEEGFAHNHNA